MRVRKLDSHVEKQIVTGMIVSSDFLSEFEYLYRPDLFQIPFAKIVAEWCWSYFESYREAPFKTIESIYREKSDKLDESISEAIETFLSTLSTEYQRKEFNTKYVLQQSEKYLQKRNLVQLQEEVKLLVADEDITGAELAVNQFTQIALPSSVGIDLFNDPDSVSNLFKAKDQNELFYLKGAARHVIPPVSRGQLISFAGPEKRGKSFNLQEIAIQAVLHGFNVLFINLEMQESEVAFRIMQNLSGAPLHERDEGALVPEFDCVDNQANICTKAKRTCNCKKGSDGYLPCSVCKDARRKEERKLYKRAVYRRKSTKDVLTEKTALKKMKAVKMHTKGATIKLVTWPQETKRCSDIRNHLLFLEKHENFICDVMIVDSADRLVPETKMEYRHGLNNIWTNLKKLQQEFNTAGLTATHTNKETHDKRIKKGSASEDRRKNEHVDRTIALNQTEQDYEDGIMRWSLLFERHGETSSSDIIVLQCLKLGKPFLDSYIEYKHKKEDEEPKKKKRTRK